MVPRNAPVKHRTIFGKVPGLYSLCSKKDGENGSNKRKGKLFLVTIKQKHKTKGQWATLLT